MLFPNSETSHQQNLGDEEETLEQMDKAWQLRQKSGTSSISILGTLEKVAAADLDKQQDQGRMEPERQKERQKEGNKEETTWEEDVFVRYDLCVH